MTASRLIKQLKRLVDKYGDRNVIFTTPPSDMRYGSVTDVFAPTECDPIDCGFAPPDQFVIV